MKKSCSEIGIWHPPGIPIILSQSMIFSYLYEKKMSNMKIENFKKSQTFYKKITKRLFRASRKLTYLSRAKPSKHTVRYDLFRYLFINVLSICN